jgi:hypothetical protein
MDSQTGGHIISTILRHDAKQNSYKIALIRAIGNIATSYPEFGDTGKAVAIPLRMLAEEWVAYYWPFVAPDTPVWQGTRQLKKSGLSQDIAFRPTLSTLRQLWENEVPNHRSSADGYILVHDMRVPRRRKTYSDALRRSYDKTWRHIKSKIKYPIRYAGPGQWQVFDKPVRLSQLDPHICPLPSTRGNEACIRVNHKLWQAFQDLSLWIEALCVHEWALYTESISQYDSDPVDRGIAYRLLTDRPDNRRPLTWERNQIDLLLMEGASFTCPWSGKDINQGIEYHIDHILPISIYPINELWNLVPTDESTNMHEKRDLIPSTSKLQAARPRLTDTYQCYLQSNELSQALHTDAALRFPNLPQSDSHLPSAITHHTIELLERVANVRNLARFS